MIDTNLVLGGLAVLAAVAFGNTAYNRAQKRKKEREISAKQYAEEQANMPGPTPEELKEIQDKIDAGKPLI